jgi:cell division protein FtsA
MKSRYLCALDLGSSKVSCALMKFIKGYSIENMFFDSVICRGIKNGKIVDIQEVSASIEQLLKAVKAKAEINIRSVYMNIYGQDITTRHSRAVIPLAERGNKVITPSDVRRAEEEARILGSSLEEEIVQALTLSYAVDDREKITNPLGLYGHKLGVDLLLISVKTAYLQGVNRLFSRLGYEVKHLFLSGLATAKVILNKDALKSGLYVFCDIGADLTELIVFEDAVLKNVMTLAVGGNHLTEEIAQAFKIPFALAEEIKRSYAYIGTFNHDKENKEIMIKKEGCYKPIPQSRLCEVVTARAELICSVLKDKLESCITKERVIDNVFVTGRTVLIDGFLEMLETHLGVPVKIATHPRSTYFPEKKLESIASIPQFLTYATSLGILQEAIELNRGMKSNRIYSTPQNFLQTITSRIKEIYQEYF